MVPDKLRDARSDTVIFRQHDRDSASVAHALLGDRAGDFVAEIEDLRMSIIHAENAGRDSAADEIAQVVPDLLSQGRFARRQFMQA
jgi:hypothetical protein